MLHLKVSQIIFLITPINVLFVSMISIVFNKKYQGFCLANLQGGETRRRQGIELTRQRQSRDTAAPAPTMERTNFTHI